MKDGSPFTLPLDLARREVHDCRERARRIGSHVRTDERVRFQPAKTCIRIRSAQNPNLKNAHNAPAFFHLKSGGDTTLGRGAVDDQQ